MKNPFKKQRNDYDSYDDAYDNGFYRGGCSCKAVF